MCSKSSHPNNHSSHTAAVQSTKLAVCCPSTRGGKRLFAAISLHTTKSHSHVLLVTWRIRPKDKIKNVKMSDNGKKNTKNISSWVYVNTQNRPRQCSFRSFWLSSMTVQTSNIELDVYVYIFKGVNIPNDGSRGGKYDRRTGKHFHYRTSQCQFYSGVDELRVRTGCQFFNKS